MVDPAELGGPPPEVDPYAVIGFDQSDQVLAHMVSTALFEMSRAPVLERAAERRRARIQGEAIQITLASDAPRADALTIFRAEMDRHSLISEDEEERLIAVLKRSHEASAALADPDARMSTTERAAHHKAEAAGTMVRDRLIHGNLRLVFHIARKFHTNPDIAANAELLDLVQEGMLGLVKGIDTYDSTKTDKFSKHAGVTISQNILRYVDGKLFLLHLPVQTAGALRKELRRVSGEVEDLGRDDPEWFQRNPLISKYEREERRAEEDARREELTKSHQASRHTSLNRPLKPDDGRTLEVGDTIIDPRASSIDAWVDEYTGSEVIEEMLGLLPEETADAISHYFGLDMNVQRSDERLMRMYNTVAEILGISAATAASRTQRGLAKLRKHPDRKRLAAKLDGKLPPTESGHST